jgi:hypothetical protein
VAAARAPIVPVGAETGEEDGTWGLIDPATRRHAPVCAAHAEGCEARRGYPKLRALNERARQLRVRQHDRA